jgi:hypothetical protein
MSARWLLVGLAKGAAANLESWERNSVRENVEVGDSVIWFNFRMTVLHGKIAKTLVR